MKEKKRLAFEIVKLLWGDKKATQAQESFEKTFQEKTPEFNIKVESGATLSSTIAPFTQLASISDAKRLIKQSAVDVNGVVAKDSNYIVMSGDKIKVGSRTFLIAK